MTPRPAFTTDSRLAGRLAALASLGAAVIHFAVVPTHWQEWILSGLFFVFLALFQLTWAALVLSRPTAPVLAAGIMINVGAIALWALSRTAGAPFGPHGGTAELVQAADLCALLLQVYVIMGAGWVWHRGYRGAPIPVHATALIAVGAVAVVALASAVGVASGMRHGHHDPAVAEVDHHGPGTDHEPHPAKKPPRVVTVVDAPATPAPLVAPPPAAVPADAAPGDHGH